LVVKSRRGRVTLAVALAALAIGDAFCTERLTITHVTRDPGTLALWQTLDKMHQPSLELTGLDRLPIAGFGPGLTDRNFLAKKHALLGYVALGNSFHERWSRHPVLSDAASGSNRIWFSPNAIEAAPTEDLFGAFVGRTDALRSIPLVVHDPHAMVATATETKTPAPVLQALATAPAAQRIPYRLVRYEPRLLSFDVDVPRDGWLFVTDRWAPGWKAWINNRPAPVFGGNFIFRAIPVAAGSIQVVMRYQPRTVPWLILLSWGTLAAVLIASLLNGRTGRGREHVARLRALFRRPVR
jgi:hypothetical protein